MSEFSKMTEEEKAAMRARRRKKWGLPSNVEQTPEWQAIRAAMPKPFWCENCKAYHLQPECPKDYPPGGLDQQRRSSKLQRVITEQRALRAQYGKPKAALRCLRERLERLPEFMKMENAFMVRKCVHDFIDYVWHVGADNFADELEEDWNDIERRNAWLTDGGALEVIAAKVLEFVKSAERRLAK